MALIQSNQTPSAPIPLPSGNLLVDNPLNPTPQNVEDTGGNVSPLRLSIDRVEVSALTIETHPLHIITNNVGAGISFEDSTTLNDDTVAVGAIGDILILRGGGNLLGTAQITATFLTLRGNKLVNFIPETNARNTNFTIDSTNQDTLCGAVIEASNALTITIDASVRNGFNVSIIQMTANNSTIVGAGGLTLRNRQGHTQTAGQWATISLYRDYSTNLILAGDTI